MGNTQIIHLPVKRSIWQSDFHLTFRIKSNEAWCTWPKKFIALLHLLYKQLNCQAMIKSMMNQLHQSDRQCIEMSIKTISIGLKVVESGCILFRMIERQTNLHVHTYLKHVIKERHQTEGKSH